jgi:hypothetical protein
MSFRAELIIEDKTYRVLHCSHTISVDTDVSGRRSSAPRFGRIDLEIESTDDIFFWAKIGLARYEPISGKIVFKKRDEEVKLKELFFQDAHVIEHTEHFYAAGESPMTIQFALSAGTLIMESSSGEAAEINNDWVDAS